MYMVNIISFRKRVKNNVVRVSTLDAYCERLRHKILCQQSNGKRSPGGNIRGNKIWTILRQYTIFAEQFNFVSRHCRSAIIYFKWMQFYGFVYRRRLFQDVGFLDILEILSFSNNIFQMNLIAETERY